MGKIVKNGITYGGKSTSAGNISYDNTTSELQSQTVQNAITELKDLVDENTGNDVGRFEKDNQGNILGEIFNTYTGNNKNIASGNASHAEGKATTANGNYSHTEGQGTTASGFSSHAEGHETTASGFISHAEGGDTIASGDESHAEGYETTASGYGAHAEGINTTASGMGSHAGGYETIATADYQTVIGKYNIADIIPEDSDTPVSFHLFIIGNGDGFNRSNIVEVTNDTFNVNGDITVAGKPLIISCDTMPTANARLLGHIVQYIGTTTNNYIHGCFYECISDGEEPPAYSWQALIDNKPTSDSGNPVTSDGVYRYTAGQKEYVNNEIRGEIFNNYTGNTKNVASGAYSHAEGSYTAASAKCAHAEGSGTLAYGQYAHAEGSATRATGVVSHAEGYGTTAGGEYSHAEGYDTTASGNYSHAEGYNTTASGAYSHAGGANTTASELCAHAEGSGTTASGDGSHAEGNHTTASGVYTHAEGYYTTASGAYSHAGGESTIANTRASTVIGKYNIADIIPSSGGGGGDSDSSDSDSSDSDTPTPTPASPKHLFIIGNGTDDEHRSNIVEVTEDTLNVNGDITIAGKPLVVQCDTMSTADEYLLGRIVQYVGATDANYTHGWFYECVSDGEEPPTYSWQALVDSIPTSGSKNPVTSNGVWARFNNIYTNLISQGANTTSVKLGNQGTSSASYTLTFGSNSQAKNVGAIALGTGAYMDASNGMAIGSWNATKADAKLLVGNGSSNSNRSNILEVTRYDVNVNGDIKRNNVPIYPLVYDSETESYIFSGLNS